MENVFEVWKDGIKTTVFTQEYEAQRWWTRDQHYNPESNYDVLEIEAPKIYKVYNPHPDNKNVGDCVKRAFTKLMGKDYKEVSLDLNRHKKISATTKFNSRDNWTSFAKTLGWIKRVPEVIKGVPRLRAWGFVEKHPKGKFLLKTRKHTIAVVDGIIYDSWDSRNEVVYHYWEVK